MKIARNQTLLPVLAVARELASNSSLKIRISAYIMRVYI